MPGGGGGGAAPNQVDGRSAAPGSSRGITSPRPFSNQSVTSSGSQADFQRHAERYSEPLAAANALEFQTSEQARAQAACPPAPPRGPNTAFLSSLGVRRKGNGPPAVDTPRQDAGADVKQIVSGLRWHVVGPLVGDLSPKAEYLPPAVVNVPQTCKGFLVISTQETLRWTLRVIEECGKYPALPIIVLILDEPKSSAAVDMLLEAQHAFESAGADDVVAMPANYTAHSLRLQATMAIRRAERRSQERQRLEKQEQEQRTHQQDPQNQDKMFWRCAHRLLPGFPKIDLNGLCPVPGVEDGRRPPPKLGEGAFGSVYLLETAGGGKPQAVKVINKGKVKDVPVVCNIWREISLLRKVSHPGIVRLHGEHHTRDHICIYMELAGGVDLHEAVLQRGGKLEMPDVWQVSIQLASALLHCHDSGIAHRDVKHENVVVHSSPYAHPEAANIFCGAWGVKLIDFGLAVEVGSVSGDVLWGTMPFCAPEVLLQSEPMTKAGGDDPRAADVWALGVLSLELAHGLGIMCRLLEWPRLVRPERVRGEQLVEFFCAGIGTLQESLPEQPSGGQVWAYRRLLSLLQGQLHLDLAARWKMARVEAFIDSQIQASGAQLNPASSASRAAHGGGAGSAVSSKVYGSDPPPRGRDPAAHWEQEAAQQHPQGGGGGRRIDPRFFSSDPVTSTTAAATAAAAASDAPRGRRGEADFSSTMPASSAANHLVYPLRNKSAIAELVKEGLRW